MNAPEPHEPAEPGDMDEARCLFVLSLLMDGRPVDEALAAEARDYAARHPRCAAALADWQRHAAELAAVPARRARPGFTDRVMAAAAQAGVGPATARAGEAGELLAFARRLAIAAGLALAVTLGYDLAHPGALRADSGLQRHRHAVDHFKADAFAPDDITAGLRGRLHDPEFGALGGERDAAGEPGERARSGR